MPKVVGIRFIRAGKVTPYLAKELDLKAGDKVVVETARGLELGDVVSAPVETNDVSKEVTPVIRVATDADLKKLETLKKQEASITDLCNKLQHEFYQFQIDSHKISLLCLFLTKQPAIINMDSIRLILDKLRDD